MKMIKDMFGPQIQESHIHYEQVTVENFQAHHMPKFYIETISKIYLCSISKSLLQDYL